MRNSSTSDSSRLTPNRITRVNRMLGFILFSYCFSALLAPGIGSSTSAFASTIEINVVLTGLLGIDLQGSILISFSPVILQTQFYLD